MSPMSSRTAALWVMNLAGLMFLMATVAMTIRMEPFFTWYYVFSWWSYIFSAEAYLHLKGQEASLFASPARFLLQLPLSVTIWLVFELFNFRLQNWHYVNVPASLPVRWIGYAVSYATVLPGLRVTALLVGRSGFLGRLRWHPLPLGTEGRRWVLAAGLGCLVLPLVWPGVFFPLVWLAFIGILLPLHRCPESVRLAKSIQAGKPGAWLEILLAGMICGLLWELWNFWAGAKWVYTVPWVGRLKLFEMPVLGFLGFPPFAVECHLMSGCAIDRWRALERARPLAERWIMRCLLGLALLLFWALTFSAIDSRTVLSHGA